MQYGKGQLALSADQLEWMPLYYLITVAVELPLLWVLLSKRHPARVKVFAGFWLTACTYPLLWLVLPPFFDTRWLYLLIGETLVPLVEIGLFWVAFIRGRSLVNSRATIRDGLAILVANLVSFVFGLLLEAISCTPRAPDFRIDDPLHWPFTLK